VTARADGPGPTLIGLAAVLMGDRLPWLVPTRVLVGTGYADHQGVMAMSTGLGPTLIPLPAVFVAVLIGVAVLGPG
jgi:hypothetical protein